MRRELWNRCDDCGRFIAFDDFSWGAIRRLIGDDTAFSSEAYETLCIGCNLERRKRTAMEPPRRAAGWRGR